MLKSYKLSVESNCKLGRVTSEGVETDVEANDIMTLVDETNVVDL